MARLGNLGITPKELDVEWTIPNFSSLSMKEDIRVYSRFFDFAGATWRLMIYPNGKKADDSVGFINLYLVKIQYGLPVNVEFFLGLKTVSGRKERFLNFAYIFDDRHRVCGATKYLPKSQLSERKSKLLPDNVLTVVLTLKHPTTVEDASNNPTSECSYCKENLNVDDILSHEKICMEKTTQCLECGKTFTMRNKENHKCRMPSTKGETETSECSYCNKCFNNLEGVILHEKSCIQKPMQCPECHDSVSLRNMNDHNCQMTRTKGGTAPPEAAIAMSCKDSPKIKPTQSSKCSDVLDQKCMMTRTADETCASGSSNIHLENKVLQDFKELFYSKEDCDVVLNVKGQEFPAHKFILKARSPVLASTFRTDMREKATGIVDIDDCNPSSFSDFMCFLYCGDINLSQENVFNLFTAADKYFVQDLRTKCLEFVKENLSVETFCDTISLGLQHIETGLIKLTIEFFLKNAPQIVLTPKWQSFVAECPIQSNELLVKLLCPTNFNG